MAEETQASSRKKSPAAAARERLKQVRAAKQKKQDELVGQAAALLEKAQNADERAAAAWEDYRSAYQKCTTEGGVLASELHAAGLTTPPRLRRATSRSAAAGDLDVSPADESDSQEIAAPIDAESA